MYIHCPGALVADVLEADHAPVEACDEVPRSDEEGEGVDESEEARVELGGECGTKLLKIARSSEHAQ